LGLKRLAWLLAKCFSDTLCDVRSKYSSVDFNVLVQIIQGLKNLQHERSKGTSLYELVQQVKYGRNDLHAHLPEIELDALQLQQATLITAGTSRAAIHRQVRNDTGVIERALNPDYIQYMGVISKRPL